MTVPFLTVVFGGGSGSGWAGGLKGGFVLPKKSVG